MANLRLTSFFNFRIFSKQAWRWDSKHERESWVTRLSPPESHFPTRMFLLWADIRGKATRTVENCESAKENNRLGIFLLFFLYLMEGWLRVRLKYVMVICNAELIRFVRLADGLIDSLISMSTDHLTETRPCKKKRQIREEIRYAKRGE